MMHVHHFEAPRASRISPRSYGFARKRMYASSSEAHRKDLELVDTREELDWLQTWIGGTRCAMWICDLHGTVQYVNHRAEELLDCPADRCTGAQCNRLVRGKDHLGRPVCRAECEIRRIAAGGGESEPVTFRLTDHDGRRWMVLAFVTFSPNGLEPLIVHCAFDVDLLVGAEDYLKRVASRSDHLARRAAPSIAVLSRRELEVLALLATDEDSQRISKRLFISHVTVRNHIQHILEKLVVHSIQEAVAWFVLHRDE